MRKRLLYSLLITGILLSYCRPLFAQNALRRADRARSVREKSVYPDVSRAKQPRKRARAVRAEKKAAYADTLASKKDRSRIYQTLDEILAELKALKDDMALMKKELRQELDVIRMSQ